MADETTTLLVRFGVIGCAHIAIKLCKAIAKAPNATLTAIGSRSLEKAMTFVIENGLPETVRVYGSYEAVLDDDQVDAVYIPLPTALHVTWAVRAAEKGKHVLLEKPVAMNVGELDRILEACEANGVQFMDGTMWVHHPRTAKMKEALSDEQRFGQLKWIHSCLTYNPGPEFLKNSIRVKPELDGLGALGDTGWYCIRAILWAKNYELPKSVLAFPNAILNDSNVILSCGSSLHWHDGTSATFHCSFLSYLSFDLTALGTNGSLRLHDFTLPFHDFLGYASFSEASQCDYDGGESGSGRWCPLPNERVVETELTQEVLMVAEFAGLVETVMKCGVRPEMEWGVVSRKTQIVLDAVKDSIHRGLEGKVALITGGARGLGECMARLFAKHGAKVVIADIRDQQGVAVQDAIGSDSATYVHCDVTKEIHVQNAVNIAISKYGKLDIMVNNAASIDNAKPSILENEVGEFERVVGVNLTGPFLGIKHAARAMIPAKQGSIITLGSVCSSMGGVATHAYTSSKHAVLGLTKNCAAELGNFGIRVNCLSPYFIANNVAVRDFFKVDDEGCSSVYSNIKGVHLQEQDVAHAALYLASDESKYISGHNLAIDGGFTTINPVFGLFSQS